jgi:hypothetical protein
MQLRTRLSTPPPDTEFARALEQTLHRYTVELSTLLNKGLKFVDNFDAEVVTTLDTGVADFQQAVPHSLKRVPTGTLLLKSDKAVILYAGDFQWTKDTVYVKFSASNCAVSYLIF